MAVFAVGDLDPICGELTHSSGLLCETLKSYHLQSESMNLEWYMAYGRPKGMRWEEFKWEKIRKKASLKERKYILGNWLTVEYEIESKVQKNILEFLTSVYPTCIHSLGYLAIYDSLNASEVALNHVFQMVCCQRRAWNHCDWTGECQSICPFSPDTLTASWSCLYAISTPQNMFLPHFPICMREVINGEIRDLRIVCSFQP